MDKLVDVARVEVIGDHRLRLTFEDGVIGDVHFDQREWRGVFEPLADPERFAQVRVDPESGTITWPGGVDMAPEPLLRGRRPKPGSAALCGSPVARAASLSADWMAFWRLLGVEDRRPSKPVEQANDLPGDRCRCGCSWLAAADTLRRRRRGSLSVAALPRRRGPDR
jgi:hypothetical protein